MDTAVDIYGAGPRMQRYLAVCEMAPYDEYLSFIPHIFQMFYRTLLSKPSALLSFYIRTKYFLHVLTYVDCSRNVTTVYIEKRLYFVSFGI